MGASQEKRKRQQLKGTESFAVKKSDEDALKAKKTRRNTIIVIVVVLVCLLPRSLSTRVISAAAGRR